MPRSLKITDYSDRELLTMIWDAQQATGDATAQEIADLIGPANDKPPRGNVSAKLAWYRRFGWVEPSPSPPGDNRQGRAWRLTLDGESYVRGRLRANQRRSLEALLPEQALDIATLVGDLYASAEQPAAHVMRRAWQYAHHQRRRA